MPVPVIAYFVTVLPLTTPDKTKRKELQKGLKWQELVSITVSTSPHFQIFY